MTCYDWCIIIVVLVVDQIESDVTLITTNHVSNYKNCYIHSIILRAKKLSMLNITLSSWGMLPILPHIFIRVFIIPCYISFRFSTINLFWHVQCTN